MRKFLLLLIKILYKFFIFVFIFITSIFLIYNLVLTSDCKKLDPVYLEWFPYHEGDELIFENNQGELESIYVKKLTINHTSRYSYLVKCGYCEDYVEVVFLNIKDSLLIKYSNIHNDKHLGKDLYFENSLDIDNYVYEGDTIISGKEYQTLETKNHLMIRTFGMVKFKKNNKIYKFKKKIGFNKKRNINDCGC